MSSQLRPSGSVHILMFPVSLTLPPVCVHPSPPQGRRVPGRECPSRRGLPPKELSLLPALGPCGPELRRTQGTGSGMLGAVG